MPQARRRKLIAIVVTLVAVAAAIPIVRYYFPPESSDLALIEPARTPADKIVNGAKKQVLLGVTYNAAYRQIDYPGGDVPATEGACTDVVIRALREAGYDLQKLIHEDKIAHLSRYPKYPNSKPVDANIDHRRVPNQVAFLRAHGLQLPVEITGEEAKTWRPGDIVYFKFVGNRDHCGVISNVTDSQGLPMVIHNAGRARQADCLTRWQIVGHFRYPKNATAARAG